MDLPQICLAICDTNAQPFVYTGSESIDITNSNMSLKPTNKNKQRNRAESKGIR